MQRPCGTTSANSAKAGLERGLYHLTNGRFHGLAVPGTTWTRALSTNRRGFAAVNACKKSVKRAPQAAITHIVGLEEYRFLSGRHFRLHAVTAQDLGQAADPPKTSRAIDAMPAPSVH